MPDASPRSLNCPNCGAPLDFPDGQSTVRCRFCDSTIERSVADLTDDDDAHIIQLDAAGQLAGSAGGPARRFVLKMRNGQPVVIEIDRPPASSRPLPTPTLEDINQANRLATARRAAARASQAASPARSSPWGCVITVAGLVGVAAFIGAIAFTANPQSGLIVQQVLAGKFDDALATSQTLGASILLPGTAVLIPADADHVDQVIALSNQYFGSDKPTQDRLLAFDLSGLRLLWQSPNLGSDLYGAPLLYDADHLYLLDGPSIRAVRRSDGALAWTAALADAVALNICQGCFQLVDGRVVTLSDDGTIAAFDAATGAPLWSDVSQQSSPRGLYVLGQAVAFMDRDESAHGYLRAYDLASGAETQVQPTCAAAEQQSYADWTMPLRVTPDGQSFYLAFGFFPSCLQRWDARTLTMEWSRPLSDQLSSGLDYLTLVAGERQLFGADGSQVLAVSLASGDAVSLLSDEDYRFTIEAVYGDHLLLRAERTRGTSRLELWEVDPATGAVRWTRVLADAEPFELDDIISADTPVWLARPTDAGVQLIWFEAAADDKSHAIAIELLDWQDGSSGGPTRTILRLPTIIFQTPSWLAWRGDVLWMIDENTLLGFDLATNTVLDRWP
ncbi:MAG: PQQ-binding-like beta-propeller repeat protein [Anaerolineales bacterium]|nr:PQQ-binding-like beta-propeller repeat protein [Anaerolineales bacterium]